MEAGLEEAERCIEAAQHCLKCGEQEEALRYLYRAQQSYPTQRAKGNSIPGQYRGLSWPQPRPFSDTRDYSMQENGGVNVVLGRVRNYGTPIYSPTGLVENIIFWSVAPSS
eukprot:g27707.t1